MDADGLPLVGPGIDYTKVEAINQKRTIAFINHFITHTSRFLNRFSCVCEDKLENLHTRIQQLEISLSLLEAKLSSVPGLENVTAPASATSATAPATGTDTAAAVASTSAPAATPAATPAAAPVAPAAEEAAPPPPAEAPSATPISKDPRYMRFFKMVQVGVPPPAVKGKMAAEGLDPSLLDDPDAPAPPDDSPKKEDSEASDSDSDSDASFSD